MTMTLSSATAAANAAKAELTAPVAANRGHLDSMPTPAPSHNAADNTGYRVPPKSPPLTGSNKTPFSANSNGKTAANGNGRTQTADQTPLAGNQPAPRSAAPARQNDPVSYPGREQAAPADDEAAVAAPLFAQLLNLADQAAAGAEAAAVETDSGSDAKADRATGSASATTLMPAMFGALLAQAAPLPAPTPAAAGDSAARSDAVGATATLNNAATRLNLSAASVAVSPAPLPSAAAQADDAAAAAAAAATPAPVSAVPAGTPQNIYAMANSAALGAQVQQSQADAPAPASSKPASDGPAPAPAAAPVVAADSAAFTPLMARAVPRNAELASSSGATDYSAASASATSAASAKDDGGLRSSAPAPAPVGNSVGFSQSAPAATPAAAVVKLAGAPEQWQQPLREALGDRLQVQLQRNNEHAVIRLEPPNMGSIEISIRHSGGALQVNLSANHSEVLRQLNTIGDSVRQDLSTRQYADVSVTVSSSRAQAQADTGGRSGQQRERQEGRTPGRALSDDDTTTFAMTSERE